MKRKIEEVMHGNDLRYARVRSALSRLEGLTSWKTIVGLGLWVLLMTVLTIKAGAQQTVFNVPTTDVLNKGKVYFELDVSAKPNDSTAVNRFSSFVPRLVVGAGHRIEAGVNLRLIQQYLGHSSLQATMIYLHLTTLGQEQARATIDTLMSE